MRGAPPGPSSSSSSSSASSSSSGVNVYDLASVPPIRTVEFPALLSLALGGIMPGATVLLWGLPSAGKSTLAAELCDAVATRTGLPSAWLDGDQGHPALVLEAFLRVGVQQSRLGSNRLQVMSAFRANDRRFRRITWRDLFASVPRRCGLVVVDSLQAFCNDNQKEQEALLTAAAGLGPIVVVISEATKDGDARGSNSNQHGGDANISVTPETLTIEKCRWARQKCPYPFERPELPERPSVSPRPPANQRTP